MTNYIYVGFYLEIPEKYIKKTVKKFVNKNNKKVKTLFNPETGEKNREVESIITDKIIPQPAEIIESDLITKFREDEFFKPPYIGTKDGFVNFVCNDEKFGLNYECNMLQNIVLKTDIYDLKLEFTTKYKDYFEYFENKYDFVEVNYGVVMYCV